jgi:hypothetical protein
VSDAIDWHISTSADNLSSDTGREDPQDQALASYQQQYRILPLMTDRYCGPDENDLTKRFRSCIRMDLVQCM